MFKNNELKPYRVVIFDLDGTLLDTEKKLSSENLYALTRAAELGILIVPCTGRFFNGMPDSVKNLPFLKYAVTINGAEVMDTAGNSIYSSTMAPDRALELMEYCRGLGVAYDCYVDNRGYMHKDHIDHIDRYLESPVYQQTVRSMRKPVEDLEALVTRLDRPVQKVQMFIRDRSILLEAYRYISECCPDLIATSSLTNNLEINNKDANKAEGLRQLAGSLGFGMDKVMAIGDGGNDVSMIEQAGIGVAMMNAVDRVRGKADFITLSCNGSGVAYAINKLILS